MELCFQTEEIGTLQKSMGQIIARPKCLFEIGRGGMTVLENKIDLLGALGANTELEEMPG